MPCIYVVSNASFLECYFILLVFMDWTYIQGKAKKVVQAQNLWFEILKSQIETGTPYMLFKVRNLNLIFNISHGCFAFY